METKTTTGDRGNLRKRLAFQLGVPFFIFVLFIFTLIAAVSFLSIEYDTTQMNQMPRRLAETASNEVSIFFSNLESILLSVSKSTDANLAITPLEEYLRNMLHENPAILELYFLTASGTPVSRLAGPTIPEDFDEGTKPVVDGITLPIEGVLSTPSRSIYGTPIAYWSFPIKDREGKTVGILRATIDLSGLWSILSKYREAGIATLYLADQAGTVIVANIKLPDVSNREAQQKRIQTLLENPSEVSEYTGIEDVQVLGMWAKVPPTNWSLIAEVPTNAFSQNEERTTASIIAIVVGVIMFLLYEIYTVRQVLLTPLSTLRGAVFEIGKGNYKTRATVAVDNELSAFAAVLNQMAQNVDLSTSAIVEQLKDLLAEQDRSSKMLIRRDLELVRANEKLRKLDEAKSQFVSVAAHQLRTPLSAVKWAVHMLLGGDMGALNTPQKEILLKAAQSNERMIKLVNDLLNVDHIESGKSEYIYVPLIVTDLIASVISELHPLAEQRGVTIQFDAGSRRFAPVLGDRDKLRGVFQNIIDNALKYSLPGGVTKIGMQEDDTHIKISIADTGIGIPPSDQSKVFSKFFRSKNAVKVATEGTGLGLFIVREIVMQHGGKIWFESIEGTGTTFHILLPKVSPDVKRPRA